ncbi:MAG: dihydroorotase [Planctomycetota bacterium]|nr:dihydroorotase [Planctomycetota bacterium]
MAAIVIRGAQVYHNGRFQALEVRADGPHISAVAPKVDASGARVIDAGGLHLFPGVIDVQVHFREPGNTHKEDLETATRACAKGGVTSFLEMPNTSPPATNQAGVDIKLALAAKKSRVNYGFFVGATNTNLRELQEVKRVCGIKVFMGASTGDLLVDDMDALERIFAETGKRRVIALHCEDEAYLKAHKPEYAHRTDMRGYTEWRNVEAAYLATTRAVNLARKYGHRAHILHVSSARECELFIPRDTLVTAETSPHHLLLNVDDYARLGTLAKMNPPLKYREDNAGLWRALRDGRIGVIATDHAPHTLEEKRRDIWKAPAGIPAVENSLALILDASSRGMCTLEQVAQWMCENPAKTYAMKGKGRIEVGHDADLTLVDANAVHTVRNEEQLTKVKWSPWHGQKLKGRAVTTIVRGQVVYENGQVQDQVRGTEIQYA